MSAIDEDILQRSENAGKNRSETKTFVRRIGGKAKKSGNVSRERSWFAWGRWVAMTAVLCVGIIIGFAFKTIWNSRTDNLTKEKEEPKPTMAAMPTAEPAVTGTPTPTPEADVTTDEGNYSGSCGANGDEVRWELDSNGVLTISGNGAMKDYGLEIDKNISPWWGKGTVKSVVIEEGVTYLGSWSFYACGVEDVTLPSSMNEVGEGAFSRCSKLTGVSMPEGLKRIDRGAFSNCGSIAEIKLPSGLTYLGAEAFYGCSRLEEITVPKQITSIEDDLFGECCSLKRITLPNGIYTIGRRCFQNCSALTEITLPKSLTEIGWFAFCDCTGLKEIILPDSMKTLYEGAFYGCNSLESITIPARVSGIGDNSFGNCSALKDVYYTGTRENWNAVWVGDRNDYLQNATWHFNAGK